MARLASFAAVAAVMAAIGLSLFAIVLRGSRTIDRQLLALRDMSSRNVALRMRVQGAAARFANLNDQTLRRIGGDIHDGPVQLMSFAALRLDSLRSQVAGEKGKTELDSIEGAVREAIGELRNISRGMSLPDLEKRPVEALLRSVAEAQGARSGMAAQVSVAMNGHDDLPGEVKTCLYRVAQEGLTNAWRHAQASQPELRLEVKDRELTFSVLDRGPGFPTGGAKPDSEDGGLGLGGLADRVESLGGQLLRLNRPGGGAELRMVLDLREVG